MGSDLQRAGRFPDPHSTRGVVAHGRSSSGSESSPGFGAKCLTAHLHPSQIIDDAIPSLAFQEAEDSRLRHQQRVLSLDHQLEGGAPEPVRGSSTQMVAEGAVSWLRCSACFPMLRKMRLGEPLSRGAYVIAFARQKDGSQDAASQQKKKRAMTPKLLLIASMAVGADLELLARMRGTWSIAQLRFESHDPMVYPAVQFLLSFCVRFCQTR